MLEKLKEIVSILEEYKIIYFKIYKKPMFLETFVEVKYKGYEIFIKILYDRDIKDFRELLDYYNQQC